MVPEKQTTEKTKVSIENFITEVQHLNFDIGNELINLKSRQQKQNIELSKLLTVLQVYDQPHQQGEFLQKNKQVMKDIFPWVVERVENWVVRQSQEELVQGLDGKLFDRIHTKICGISNGREVSQVISRFWDFQKNLKESIDGGETRLVFDDIK